MSESTDKQPEPQVVQLEGQILAANATIRVGALTVLPADDIEIEEAETLKFLRLRVGDYQVPKSVFLIVDGERYEITQDALPTEGSVEPSHEG